MNRKIAVIADDLTGANDTGVQFSKQGLETVVMMDACACSGIGEAKVIVLDTGSRAIPPAEAYEKVARAASLLKEQQFHHIYKKVDSTLRGNLGAEIDAIMDTCGQDLAIVAPAFPKNGRVTIGGYHLLQANPLESTEIARDPRCPVTESHLPTLLAAQTSRAVGHLGIKTIQNGAEGVFTGIQELLNDGKTVIVCDVWRDEHFEMIASAGARLEKSVLWVGSAGLAECLPAILGLESAPVGKSPIAVIAGSVSGVTRNQVAVLKRRSDVAYIEVDPCALLRQETKNIEIERCFSLVKAAFDSGRDVVLASGYSDEIVQKTKARGTTLGLQEQRTSEIVAQGLGDLCRRLIDLHLGGLILTGGDIAVGSCRCVGATGLKVIREIAPGIPLGILRGGLCDGMPVVTKAGAFGSDDALEMALECLKAG